MTEEEARAWIAARWGETALGRLSVLVDLVVEENGRQNLISPSTVELIWARHVVDSAQLVPLAPVRGAWIDIGTGGGFPGLVVALLRPGPMLLVEPRRKRAAFLESCVVLLGISDQVRVATAKIEGIATSALVISARAVASVENLLLAAGHCATTETRWLLPRGRFSEEDLAVLKRNWCGMFHVEQSLTDPDSSILVLDGVSRR